MKSVTDQLSVKDWDKVKVIGRGGSSTVYKCVVRETQERLAVKEITTDGMTPDQIRGIGGEVETIKNLSHDNIVRCFGSEQVDNKLYIMLEYCGRGSLRKLYQDNGRLSEPQAARCITLVLRGLEYLHANGVAHRDVKGANILLTDTGELKLADFGASKKMETESLVSGLKGTPHWMAPEVIKGTQMSTGWMKADVWSLGCTLVEVLSASLPFSEYDNPMTAMYQIASGKIPPLPSGASAEASSFVHDCCAADPEQRPTVTALLQHPFLRKCRSDIDDDEFSEQSALFELPSSLEVTTVSLMTAEGSTDIEASVAVQSPIADEALAEEMVVDDGVDDDHAADVNKFIEQRKGQVPIALGGLSVRTSSFRVADGEALMALECQETPVLHKARKGIHTMSSHNMLNLTDSQSAATTPALGASRRPPLQVATSREGRMSVSSVSGIANGAMVLDSSNDSDIADTTVVEDEMESVISPRLTSLKVSSTANTPTAFNNSRLRTFSAVDTAADISRATTAAATPEQPPVVMRPMPIPVKDTVAATPSAQPSSPLVAAPEPTPIVFQIGSSDSTKPGGQTGTKNHITPMKRKHRANRKHGHLISGHKDYRVEHRSQGQHVQNVHSDNSSSAQKHNLKIGTVNISGSRDNSRTPTTKTIGGIDPLSQPRNSPRVSPRGKGDDSSTEIVFTSSGGQKRKLRAAPAGNAGCVPHKVSTSSRRGHSKGANGNSNHVDLVKVSALPPIGANQPAIGLTGKKKDKNDSSSKSFNLIEKADSLLRPSAPMSGDKLQYSGEVHTASMDGDITHGSSTGSTTISQACAIAAELNFGKIGEVLVGDSPKRHEKDEHRIAHKHHAHRQHGPHHPVAPDHRHPRQVGMPKGRLASLKHSSIRSHSAGVVPSEITALPTSNNLSSSSSRPQLPMLHKNKGMDSDGGDDVLRAIQTAPAPSRLPPIGGAPSDGALGSLTPVDRLLSNASPAEGLALRNRR